MSAQNKEDRVVVVPAHTNKSFKYKNYLIVPRQEHGWFPEEDNYGFWVTDAKTGGNPMPGACWFRSHKDAVEGIQMLELSKGDSDLFWLLMQNAGLSTTVATERNSPFSVASSLSANLRVEGRRGNKKLTFRFKNIRIELTPKEALVLSAIVHEGAKLTLAEDWLDTI